jgi:hypothetical protein
MNLIRPLGAQVEVDCLRCYCYASMQPPQPLEHTDYKAVRCALKRALASTTNQAVAIYTRVSLDVRRQVPIGHPRGYHRDLVSKRSQSQELHNVLVSAF